MNPSGVIDDARAAAAARDAQVGDGRRERLGDVADHARVGVERLGLARQGAGRGGLSGVLQGHLLDASDCVVGQLHRDAEPSGSPGG